MKFNFRLQKLLDHRLRIRDQKLSFLAEQNKKLNDLKEKKNHLIQQVKVNRKLYSSEVDNEKFLNLQSINQFVDLLVAQIEKQDQLINKQQQVVESYRIDLVKANTDFKAIEKLKEIQKEEFNVKKNKIESNEIDEMNIIRHKRSV